MNRLKAAVLAVLMGGTALAATTAVSNTMQLGLGGPEPQGTLSADNVAQREALLARQQSRLDALLASKPPALPKVPRFAKVAAAASSAAGSAALRPVSNATASARDASSSAGSQATPGQHTNIPAGSTAPSGSDDDAEDEDEVEHEDAEHEEAEDPVEEEEYDD